MTDYLGHLSELDVLAKLIVHHIAVPQFRGEDIVTALTALPKLTFQAIPYARIGQREGTMLVRYIPGTNLEYAIVADGEACLTEGTLYKDISLWVIPRPAWAPRDRARAVPLGQVITAARNDAGRVAQALDSVERS